MTAMIARAFKKLAAKSTYWGETGGDIPESKYASKMLNQ